MDYFKGVVEEQKEIHMLTRDVMGTFFDWIAVYPVDRGNKSYKQKSIIHYQFIGKLAF